MAGSHHQTIKRSKFGDHATVCLVHNDYGSKRKGASRVKSQKFLDQLCPSPPIPCQLEHGGLAASSLPRRFDAVVKSNDFCQWQAGKREPVFIIRDPTSKWHCTLIREASSLLSRSGTVGSYLPTADSADAETQVPLGDILRAIMRSLLQQWPRAQRMVQKRYQRVVGPNATIDLLANVFKLTIALVAEESKRPIYIITRSIFRIPEELTALLAFRDPRIRWLLTLSPSISVPTKLEAVSISATGYQVAESAGLGHVVEFIQQYGRSLQQRYAAVKARGLNEDLSVADFWWFRYTKSGRLLLHPSSKTVVSYRYVRDDPQKFLVSFIECIMSASDGASRPVLYLDDTVFDGATKHANSELVFTIQLALFAQFIIRTSPCPDDAAETVATMLMLALEHNDALISELRVAVLKPAQEGKTSVLRQAQSVVQLMQGISQAFLDQASSLVEGRRMHVLVNARRGDANPAFLAKYLGALGPKFTLFVSRPCDELPDQPKRYTRLTGGSIPINHVNPDSEYTEFMDSLSSRSVLKKRRPRQSALDGTNSWLWDDAVYKAWMATGGVLLIKGKSGSGKSVLAKTISNKFQEANPSEEWCVSTWFCKEQEAGKPNEYLLMLCSILWQTLYAHKAGFCAIRAMTRSLYDEHGNHPRWETIDLNLDDLTRMLSLLGRCPSIPSCVWVIDALDEPDGHTRGPLAAVTAALIGVSSSSMLRIRIIVLSKPLCKVKQAFGDCRYIDMNKRNSQDIKTLVRNRLGQLEATWSNVHNKVLSEDEQGCLKKIGRIVAENATGIMLWVVFVFQQLLRLVSQDFSIRLLRDKASELPPGLERLYENNLTQVRAIEPNGQLSTSSLIVFQWIIGTAERGRFRLGDLKEALAIPSEPIKLQSGYLDVIEEGLPQSTMDDYIYRHCGLLVEVVSPGSEEEHEGQMARMDVDWTVQFNHKSTSSWLQARFPKLRGDVSKEYVASKLHEYVNVVLPKQLIVSPGPVNTKHIPSIIDYLGRRSLLKFAFRQLKSCDETSMAWFRSRMPSPVLASQQPGPLQCLRSIFSTSFAADGEVNMHILKQLVDRAWIPSSAGSRALKNMIEFLLSYSAFITKVQAARSRSHMGTVVMMIRKLCSNHQCCLCHLAKVLATKIDSVPQAKPGQGSGHPDWARYVTELEAKCLRDRDGNSHREIAGLLLIPSMRISRKGP